MNTAQISTAFVHMPLRPNHYCLLTNLECELLKNRAQIAAAEERATTDGLTFLLNRSGWEAKVKEEYERSQRTNNALVFIRIDIDNFKLVNDGYSHQTGDNAIQFVAWTAVQVLRKTDIVARLGGDEFCAVAHITIDPNVTEEERNRLIKIGAEKVLKKIRDSIENGAFRIDDNDVERLGLPYNTGRLTASVGGVLYRGKREITQEKLLSAADAAAYKSKKNGKNQWSLDISYLPLPQPQETPTPPSGTKPPPSTPHVP